MLYRRAQHWDDAVVTLIIAVNLLRVILGELTNVIM